MKIGYKPIFIKFNYSAKEDSFPRLDKIVDGDLTIFEMKSEFQPNIEIGFSTHVGRRKDNQDVSDYDENERGLLLVVCDGMGGAVAGNLASRLCADRIIDVFKNSESDNIKDLLIEAVQKSNTLVYNESQKDPDLNGMGTTCVIALIKDSLIYYANVGDSRIYFIEKSSKDIIQITKDHSLAQFLLDEGRLTEEEAANYPNKNIITRAIGTQPDIIVDVGLFHKRLTPGDIVLLCTDGLSGVVNNDVIAKNAIKNNPQEACDKLVEIAYNAGGVDNITVQIAKCISELQTSNSKESQQ